MSKIEKIREKLKSKKFGIDTVELAYNIDTSPTKKYTEHLVKFNSRFTKEVEENMVDEMTHALSYLEKFDMLSTNGLIEDRDLSNYHKLSDIKSAIDGANLNKSRGKAKKEIQVLFEDDVHLIFKPLSYDAAKVYGSGTKWCIVQESYFYRYVDRGVLIYVINKSKNQKFGVYYDINESYYDEHILPKIIKGLSKKSAFTSLLGDVILSKSESSTYNRRDSEVEELYKKSNKFSVWTDWDDKIDMMFVPIPGFLKTLIVDNCLTTQQNLSLFLENNIKEYEDFRNEGQCKSMDDDMGLAEPQEYYERDADTVINQQVSNTPYQNESLDIAVDTYLRASNMSEGGF